MADQRIDQTDANIMILGLSTTCMLDTILRLYSIVPWIPLPVVFFFIRSILKKDGKIAMWVAVGVYFGMVNWLVRVGGVWQMVAVGMLFGAGIGMMGYAVWRTVGGNKDRGVRLEEDVGGYKRGLRGEVDRKEKRGDLGGAGLERDGFREGREGSENDH